MQSTLLNMVFPNINVSLRERSYFHLRLLLTNTNTYIVFISVFIIREKEIDRWQ
jgi:hypothetical protein